MDAEIAPLRGETDARLVFTNGCSPRVTVRAGAPAGMLAESAFEGPSPAFDAAVGEVRVTFPGLFASIRKGFLRPGEIRLNARVAWTVEIRGGIARARIDLRGIDARGVRVHGGASDVEMFLDAPRGVVPIVVEGGASSLRVTRAKGSATRLDVRGGASSVQLDGDSFGAMGGPISMGSPGAKDALDRYQVEVRGGASRLVVEEASS